MDAHLRRIMSDAATWKRECYVMTDLDNDRRSLLPDPNLSRRRMLAASLSSGFALAVQPVSAQTITTDTNGLEAGEVKIPVDDGEIPAYRAMPAKGGPFPVVLVVQEIFGVHEHIKDLCRRLRQARLPGHRARAVRAAGGRLEDRRTFQEIISKVVSQGPRRAGDVRPRRRPSPGPRAPARPTRRSSASPASAGAAGSSGCTRRTTRT